MWCVRLSGALLVCLIAQPAFAQEATSGLADRPVLVREPNKHTEMIIRADVDADGRIAATASFDKTIRLWSVADGRLIRTIRVPIGPGNVGRLYAVAISPQADLIAAGGLTRSPELDGVQHIYLFDANSGEMLMRIEGLPAAVRHLVFSPEGRYLAAVLDGSNGLRVYDRELDWAERARDMDYDDTSYMAAFASDGRLATTSNDGWIRLYDRNFELSKRAHTGRDELYGIAFSPDGKRLAVAFYVGTEVAIYDGHTLARLPAPDSYGIEFGNLFAVAWSSSGATLYAAGTHRDDKTSQVMMVIAWDRSGADPHREVPASTNTITSLEPLSNGSLFVASADPLVGVFDGDGNPLWTKGPATADFRGQYYDLSVSADGGAVEFGYERGGERRARFDLASLSLIIGPADDGRLSAPSQEGLPIDGWRSRRPTLYGEQLLLKRFEGSKSLAIHPDGTRFVLGAEWSLRAFDDWGNELWTNAVPGIPAWAVNISDDGRLVIAAYSDGTIRWHRMEDGAELLALFPLINGKDWVVWTPEGVYSATPGAQGILRWHVNRGWDMAAEAIPAYEIPETNRPDVIRHVLQEMGTGGAIQLVELAKIRDAIQRRTRAAVAPGARLHILTVGVGDYGKLATHVRLEYADDDARDIASALAATQAGLYAAVPVQTLLNEEATKAGILRGLSTMRQAMERGEGRDLAVVHFSGHGAMVDGTFHLLTHEVDARDDVAIKGTALPVQTLQSEIEQLAKHGRVLLLLDACRSGATTGDGRSVAVDADALRASLRGPNITILTSSTADELSREDSVWGNGAFTEAFLDALTERADGDGNGLISTDELMRHVVEVVGRITGGAQTPGVDLRFGSSLFAAGIGESSPSP